MNLLKNNIGCKNTIYLLILVYYISTPTDLAKLKKYSEKLTNISTKINIFPEDEHWSTKYVAMWRSIGGSRKNFNY